MRSKLLIGAVMTVALLGVACGGDDAPEATGGGEEAAGGGTVSLTAAEFAFKPASITAAAGDTIEFTNEDEAEHNITAEDAGIDEDVAAGGSTTVDLSGVEPGTYEFVCEYHPDTMKGTLEVTG